MENDTRGRILAAACEVFGELGFKAATVRRITQAAGVNAAAVNYHFQGKRALYQAVFERCFEEAFAAVPPVEFPAGAPPEEKLALFIRAYVHRIFSPGGPGFSQAKTRLVLRELVEPVGVEGPFKRRALPELGKLGDVVEELLGPGLAPDARTRTVFSILGQCLVHVFARTMVGYFDPEFHTSFSVEALADHIVRFSLGGTAALAKGDSHA